MNELIKITEHNGLKVVSARDLHAYLENPDNVNTWFKRQVEKAMLTENEDFVCIAISQSNGRGGQNKLDYALTIPSAKEISMLNGGEKGKEARTYFLECEKIAKRVLSPAEQNLENAKYFLEIERKQKETDERISKTEQAVLMLEAKSQTRSDYFTIVGYATLNGVACGLKIASALGKKATALCNQRNIPTESLPDPRFGVVKTYPIPILEEVFSMNLV